MLDIKNVTTGYRDYRIAVPTAYQQVFSHFYFAENRTGQTIRKTLLPSYQTILLFNFGKKAILQSAEKAVLNLEKCIVLGPIKKAFDYSLPDQSEILVVAFKDDAFYRFFGDASLAEDLPIDPDTILQQDCFTGLWKKLNEMEGDGAEENILLKNDLRINHILEFCKPYLIERSKIAEQLANFKQDLTSSIKSTAAANNQTERTMQMQHKKYFGYTSKELNRYRRFLKAIELIANLVDQHLKVDWFHVIESCGYYDQSQLIHDFKFYTSLSPSKYLKFQKDICS